MAAATNGWTQVCKLHVCVSGDGRHEQIALKVDHVAFFDSLRVVEA